jgi:uncharacterized protein (TIGR03437 family)
MRVPSRPYLLCLCVAAPLFGQTNCLNFPANFVPFSSIAYVTAANSVGDHLVVGTLAVGPSGINVVPLPNAPNQLFCDSQVQLAPQQFYPNVYVPTAQERSGNFSAFNGLFVNPTTNQPYPGGIIPPSQFGTVFAWRIGPPSSTSAARGWSPTGSMSVPRLNQATALLPDGKVLVLGSRGMATAEIFDPVSGAFTPTGTPLIVHGDNATATLLNNGRVLIVGGRNQPTSAELYDPSTGKFLATGTPLQGHGFGQTATLLGDGRVLIIGGLSKAGNGGDTTDVNSGADIYDPVKGAFSSVGNMSTNRLQHTATLLSDGRVLVAGGNMDHNTGATNTAEIFDPAASRFTTTGSMQAPRSGHGAVRLANGTVLVAAGFIATAELFDPKTGTFHPTGGLSTPHDEGTTVLLSSGQVLIAGGFSNYPAASNTAELYNPASGTFSSTGNMTSARGGHSSTVLFDGRVLVIGGVPSCCDVVWQSAELYTPVTQGLVTSQTGLTFRAAQSSATAQTQTVTVLSGTDSIPWTVSTHEYSGAGWLSVTPSSGSSDPGSTSSTLSITVNPSGLAAQDYYGVVTLTPTDAKHPPVSISIVLTINPAGTSVAPVVSPTGLVFLAVPGTSPKPQTFTITNLNSQSLTFGGTGSPTPAWFDFAPKNGALPQTATITVTPSTAGLAAGVYRGSIQITFGDRSTQTVDLLLVISSTVTSNTPLRPEQPESQPGASSACNPTKLLPVFTSIGSGFLTPAAWPNALQVQVVDDCGAAVNTGIVSVSFSNADPPVALVAIGNGNWAGTWAPVHNSASVTARVDALSPPLTGSTQIAGGVASNPRVPSLTAGGVVSSGDYTSAPALGLLVSIFGSALADGTAPATALPLATRLGSTSVTVAGRALPLLYVSDTQINVMIPYDLPVNAPFQMIVQRGNAISVPAPVAVFDAEPAILATAGNGIGQGHIYKIDAAGNAFLADRNTPATAGDALVMYVVGLGAVAPGLTAGNPSLVEPLSKVIAPVTVTIGGVNAPIFFSGLTPGFAGLYQVNVTVPAGIQPGGQIPVSLAVAGKSSPGAIVMAIR